MLPASKIVKAKIMIIEDTFLRDHAVAPAEEVSQGEERHRVHRRREEEPGQQQTDRQTDGQRGARPAAGL